MALLCHCVFCHRRLLFNVDECRQVYQPQDRLCQFGFLFTNSLLWLLTFSQGFSSLVLHHLWRYFPSSYRLDGVADPRPGSIIAFGLAATVIFCVLAFILSVQCVHVRVCEVACEVSQH